MCLVGLPASRFPWFCDAGIETRGGDGANRTDAERWTGRFKIQLGHLTNGMRTRVNSIQR